MFRTVCSKINFCFWSNSHRSNVWLVCEDKMVTFTA